MSLHMDKYTRLIDDGGGGISQLWLYQLDDKFVRYRIRGSNYHYPEYERIVGSAYGDEDLHKYWEFKPDNYKESIHPQRQNNFKYSVAPDGKEPNVTPAIKEITTGPDDKQFNNQTFNMIIEADIYPKEWLWKTLWHLYNIKNSTLLKAFAQEFLCAKEYSLRFIFITFSANWGTETEEEKKPIAWIEINEQRYTGKTIGELSSALSLITNIKLKTVDNHLEIDFGAYDKNTKINSGVENKDINHSIKLIKRLIPTYTYFILKDIEDDNPNHTHQKDVELTSDTIRLITATREVGEIPDFETNPTEPPPTKDKVYHTISEAAHAIEALALTSSRVLEDDGKLYVYSIDKPLFDEYISDHMGGNENVVSYQGNLYDAPINLHTITLYLIDQKPADLMLVFEYTYRKMIMGVSDGEYYEFERDAHLYLTISLKKFLNLTQEVSEEYRAYIIYRIKDFAIYDPEPEAGAFYRELTLTEEEGYQRIPRDFDYNPLFDSTTLGFNLLWGLYGCVINYAESQVRQWGENSYYDERFIPVYRDHYSKIEGDAEAIYFRIRLKAPPSDGGELEAGNLELKLERDVLDLGADSKKTHGYCVAFNEVSKAFTLTEDPNQPTILDIDNYKEVYKKTIVQHEQFYNYDNGKIYWETTEENKYYDGYLLLKYEGETLFTTEYTSNILHAHWKGTLAHKGITLTHDIFYQLNEDDSLDGFLLPPYYAHADHYMYVFSKNPAIIISDSTVTIPLLGNYLLKDDYRNECYGEENPYFDEHWKVHDAGNTGIHHGRNDGEALNWDVGLTTNKYRTELPVAGSGVGAVIDTSIPDSICYVEYKENYGNARVLRQDILKLKLKQGAELPSDFYSYFQTNPDDSEYAANLTVQALGMKIYNKEQVETMLNDYVESTYTVLINNFASKELIEVLGNATYFIIP